MSPSSIANCSGPVTAAAASSSSSSSGSHSDLTFASPSRVRWMPPSGFASSSASIPPISSPSCSSHSVSRLFAWLFCFGCCGFPAALSRQALAMCPVRLHHLQTLLSGCPGRGAAVSGLRVGVPVGAPLPVGGPFPPFPPPLPGGLLPFAPIQSRLCWISSWMVPK